MSSQAGPVSAKDSLPLREDLRGQTPYGAPQLDVAVRLNTNENSYPLPPEVARSITAALAEQVTALNRYPDREFTALRADLASYLTARATAIELSAEQIWAANGSNEVLQHLFQAYGGPGRRALGFTPGYSMHPLLAGVTVTEWVHGTRGLDGGSEFELSARSVAAQILKHDPDLVFIVSPNNPTGTAVDLDVVRAAVRVSRGLVVVDEAYAEFARAGTPSALDLLPGHERLVVTRTMSKAFAFAGARVGYLAAAPEVIDGLRLVRLPYHLSALTQAAARAALAHADALLATVEAIRMQRDRIVSELSSLGLQPVPSDANFVLFGGLDDAAATWRGLLEHDVLVRDVGIAHHLRVTAGTPQETTAFLTALAQVLGVAPTAATAAATAEIASLGADAS